MNDKELADKVIALGVGTQGKYPLSCDGVGFYQTPDDESGGLCAELFVRDWRVAGALMEKALAVVHGDLYSGWCKESKEWVVTLDNYDNNNDILTGDNLPRAIIEASVEALS